MPSLLSHDYTYPACNVAIFSFLSTLVVELVLGLLPTRSAFQRKLAIRLVGRGAVVPAMLFNSVFRTSPSVTSAVSPPNTKSVVVLELGRSDLPTPASTAKMEMMKFFC